MPDIFCCFTSASAYADAETEIQLLTSYTVGLKIAEGNDPVSVGNSHITPEALSSYLAGSQREDKSAQAEIPSRFAKVRCAEDACIGDENTTKNTI